MSLCRTTNGKGGNRTQQLGLLPVYLLLRLKYGIDKFLIRNLPVEMPLDHIIVYLELGVLIEFFSDPCLDVERRIPVVGHIDSDKLSTG